MNVKPAFAALLLGGNLFAQTPADSVTIQGTVSDFNGNPVDSCTVMWKSPSFRNVIQVMTDPKGIILPAFPRVSTKAWRLAEWMCTCIRQKPKFQMKTGNWSFGLGIS